jgi:hypothetical protein
MRDYRRCAVGSLAVSASRAHSLPARPGGEEAPRVSRGNEPSMEPASASLAPPPGAVPVAAAGADPAHPCIYPPTSGTWRTITLPGSSGSCGPDGSGGDPNEAVGAVSFFGRRHAHRGHRAEQTPGVKRVIHLHISGHREWPRVGGTLRREPDHVSSRAAPPGLARRAPIDRPAGRVDETHGLPARPPLRPRPDERR